MIAQQHVGKYSIQRELGAGSAGTAFLATNDETGEQVAIKLLNAKSADNLDIQKRFVREVSVLEKLDHPNVVKHLDCGIDELGRLYFVMELVDAGTLQSALKASRRLNWQDACSVAAQICDALDHAHRRGVIHRDLKPANLFLSSDGMIKVGDFGLARDMNLHRLTAHGNTVGTCRYMAPEQVRGEDELTGAADLYAVGCMLFEMIAGHPPYDGDNVVEIFEHHLFSPIPRLDKIVPNCPTAVADYVEQLMGKTLAERPISAESAHKTLQALAAGEDVDVNAGTYRSDVQLADTKRPPNLTQRISQPAIPEKQVNQKAVVIALTIVAIIVIVIATFNR